MTPVPRGTISNGEKKSESLNPPQTQEKTTQSDQGTYTIENFLKNTQQFENALETMLESISKGPSNGNSKKRKSAADDDGEFEIRPKRRRASDRSSSSVASDVSVHSIEEDSPHQIMSSVEEDVNLFLRYVVLAEQMSLVH